MFAKGLVGRRNTVGSKHLGWPPRLSLGVNSIFAKGRLLLVLVTANKIKQCLLVVNFTFGVDVAQMRFDGIL